MERSISYIQIFHIEHKKSASCFRSLIGTCKPRHQAKTERAKLERHVRCAQTTLGADVLELLMTKGCKFYQSKFDCPVIFRFLLLSVENHLLEMDFNRQCITLTSVFKNASHSLMPPLFYLI